MRTAVLALFAVILSVGVIIAQSTSAQTVGLSVTGMHCDNCTSKVDRALRGVEGVKDVKVDLKSGSAEVSLASSSVKTDALVKAVSEAGYGAETTSATTKSEEEKCSRCPDKEGHKHKEGTAKGDDCCRNKRKSGAQG